jgi:hypothetical protein
LALTPAYSASALALSSCAAIVHASGPRAEATMLTEIDQNTIAHMTAALEHVCKRIPPEEDNHELRKRIVAAMIECANNGMRTFIDFKSAGSRVLAEAIEAKKFDWFGFGRLFRRL